MALFRAKFDAPASRNKVVVSAAFFFPAFAPEFYVQELESLKRATEDLEKARRALDKAMQDSNYEEASRLQYVQIPELEKKAKKAEEAEENPSARQTMVGDSVTAADIATVISRATGLCSSVGACRRCGLKFGRTAWPFFCRQVCVDDIFAQVHGPPQARDPNYQ